MATKPEVLLENWQRCSGRLYGQFYRHAVIPDGAFAHTSRLVYFVRQSRGDDMLLFSVNRSAPDLPGVQSAIRDMTSAVLDAFGGAVWVSVWLNAMTGFYWIPIWRALCRRWPSLC